MNIYRRIEADSFGDIEVFHMEENKKCFWGAQTQRSIENFKFRSKKESMPIEIIEALVLIKKIAAKTNYDLSVLSPEKYKLISDACDQILLNKNNELDDQFPLVIWQTGSGTQTNMNVNEVIANISAYNNSKPLGQKDPIHPNDDVNKSQSSNDTFPTSINIAVYKTVKNYLIPSLLGLIESFKKKIIEFDGIIKIGRTHLQDATPLYLSQEISAFLSQIEYSLIRINDSLKGVKYLAQGGTAVGSGINCPNGFAEKFIENLNLETGMDFKTADNKFEALATNDNIVFLGGALNCLAVSLMKIANDIRLLGSGPRCGIGELILPENEPGSSIMPGKVNPTQCESLTMICAEVMASQTTLSIAGSNGHMQLNVFKPVMAASILRSINLLADGIKNFTKNCIDGLSANKHQISKSLQNSLMLVTSLNPFIGYDNAAKIAKFAHTNNISLREAALKLNLISPEEFDKIVKPESMIN